MAESGDFGDSSGIDDVKIGDTVCTKESPKPPKRINVDDPMLSIEYAMDSEKIKNQGKTDIL